ncbi:hypothetical protein FKM82_012362 [Ascaphus truei]
MGSLFGQDPMLLVGTAEIGTFIWSESRLVCLGNWPIQNQTFQLYNVTRTPEEGMIYHGCIKVKRHIKVVLFMPFLVLCVFLKLF